MREERHLFSTLADRLQRSLYASFSSPGSPEDVTILTSSGDIPLQFCKTATRLDSLVVRATSTSKRVVDTVSRSTFSSSDSVASDMETELSALLNELNTITESMFSCKYDEIDVIIPLLTAQIASFVPADRDERLKRIFPAIILL